MVPWCLCATVPVCQAALVPWYNGATVPWCHGATVPWCHCSIVPRCHGATVPWCLGDMAPWCLGSMAPRSHGALVPWFHGATVPWIHGATVLSGLGATVHGYPTLQRHHHGRPLYVRRRSSLEASPALHSTVTKTSNCGMPHRTDFVLGASLSTMPHSKSQKSSSCDAVVFRERPLDIVCLTIWNGTHATLG
ncbi:hypothetical protein CQW23_33312 [Capsicum baccatum]|uniref:Secreted protein n=1 Tax=Capsicum baccatum TaxID=33114 RepID=A0A2G2V2E6_CAPBA|nr:hypothetical protein CQW23_33312 [Capsicum baccatum]